MMASLRHRLVLMAMPKCASTALEVALAPYMDVVIHGAPPAKHTTVRKYQRHLKKYFESFSDGPMETVCVFREPRDWLNSWWRYRGREGIPNPARSTRGMDFETFVQHYLNNAQAPADLGRQSRFVSDSQGVVAVDHLFRYEDLDALVSFVSDRMHLSVTLDHRNVSPQAHSDANLSAKTNEMLRAELSLDYEIYDGLKR